MSRCSAGKQKDMQFIIYSWPRSWIVCLTHWISSSSMISCIFTTSNASSNCRTCVKEGQTECQEHNMLQSLQITLQKWEKKVIWPQNPALGLHLHCKRLCCLNKWPGNREHCPLAKYLEDQSRSYTVTRNSGNVAAMIQYVLTVLIPCSAYSRWHPLVRHRSGRSVPSWKPLQSAH